MFTEGVIDVFLENGVRFDGMIGVSAGSLFGCNLKSHQIGRALRYNVNLRHDPRYMGWWNYLTTGEFISKEFTYHVVPTQIDVFDTETFEKDPMEFYLVCTDIVEGKPIYKKLDKVDYEGLEWMRAGGSLPLICKPVHIEGKVMLDGGISDSIPLKYFQSIGYKRNLVVLTQPLSYRKGKNPFKPLFKMFLSKYPKVAELMSKRHEMYNSQVAYVREEAEKGETMLICPDESLHISRTCQNEKELRRAYETGRRKGLEKLQEVMDFLSR